MLVSLQQTLPEQWQQTLHALASGFAWILDFQRTVLPFAVTGNTVAGGAAKAVVLLLPTALLVAALWCTMASLYTLPFRSGRGAFLTVLLMSWWDAGRMMWFYWAGLVRLVVVLLGWIWNLLKLVGSLLWRLLKFIVTRPFALLDWTTRQYFQPGAPWLAFLFILFWSALEATIFTYTLRPTIMELLADITGREMSSLGVSLVLWPFLFGRFGTPTFLMILARHSMPGGKAAIAAGGELDAEFWRGPVAALKAETAWFKQEAREAFELLTLPVLQVLAAGLNFAVVMILGRPIFSLPFKSLDQVLASTPQVRAAAPQPMARAEA